MLTSHEQLTQAETGVTHVYTAFGITPTPTFSSNTAFQPVAAFTGTAPENETYFFHPDHLGSSNYITNFVGDVSQHMEYFAFGETFIEEHKNSNNSPYKFNGKELDEESGLYYYGARYYSSRENLWISVDPPIYDGTFLAGQHNGGIFNSFNHNSYMYCYQNPINLFDPNGKQSYFMNSRGFWIEGDSKFGEYIGNVKPETDRYMELTKIKGALYHKNTNAWLVGLWNDTFDTDFVSKKAYSLEEETLNDGIRMGAEFAIGGMLFKAVGGIAGQLLKRAGGSLWGVGIARGFVYERMLGLKGLMKTSNFPVIDAFFGGTATSVKTMLLGTETYLGKNAVFNTLKGYINKLKNFKGASHGGEEVLEGQIKKRVLEVGIPKGATKAQLEQITKAVQYGKDAGIQVNVRVVR